MRVYVVNSSPTIRTAIVSILNEAWEVVGFGSGEEFLESIRQEQEGCVILLSVNMPDMDGFEVMEHLQHNEHLKEYPVVFITEANNKDVELKCLKVGAADFISSPFNPDVIYQRVEHVISQYLAYNAMVTEVKRFSMTTADPSGEEYRKVTYQVLTSLSATIDAKDYYTKGHSSRVAEYSLLIGRDMGLSKEELEILYHGALLHDIGKIGISDVILRKNGDLDMVEYDIIKRHPVIGYNILKTITLMPDIAKCARWHHERFDGSGYPDSLKGNDIPLYPRIISVADAYDAMTSDRSYRRAMSIASARDELITNKGLQFDPYMADIMLRLIEVGQVNKNTKTVEGRELFRVV